MSIDPAANDPMVSRQIALAMINGFDKHYMLFRDSSRLAKERFEQADWIGVHQAVSERIRFYEERVKETINLLNEQFEIDNIDDDTWRQAKLLYIGLLIEHKQPELAETFFNSVTTRILTRSHFNNDYMFVRPSASTDFIEAEETPNYRSYYVLSGSLPYGGLMGEIRQILLDFDWTCPFANLRRDVAAVYRCVREHFGGTLPRREVDFQIQVLGSAFYRNKAAYIMGKAINGAHEFPFAVPVLKDDEGRLYVDTVLLEPWRISVLFSLSRAYFMTDMEVPSAYILFLHGIMPGKPRSELYIMLGLGKQGKTMFFRDLIYHLKHSEDRFIMAPGIPGLVMLVFTLPSYPYVFKVIRDVFGSPKNTDRATVKQKFLMVKQVDRIGRMADTLEFSNAVLPLNRFDPRVLEELQRLAPSTMEIVGDKLIIRHLYIERRMEPLNMHLERMEAEDDQEALEHCVRDYGNAIRELAQANIFPGDLLWKNFGVTRYRRVVFYDYDEIEYLENINFRRIPPAPDFETEMSGEVWYKVAPNDVFPEEFATFLLTLPSVRKIFMRYHSDLLNTRFWQDTQEKNRIGHVEDFFPYPQELRLNAQDNSGDGAEREADNLDKTCVK